MKTSPSGAAPKAAFWTWRKKLFLLLLVLFVAFSYYYMSHGAQPLYWYAMGSSPGRLEPFSFIDFLSYIWTNSINHVNFWGTYSILMAPFVLGYLIWWFRPNVLRSIFPLLYILTIGSLGFLYLHGMTAFEWPQEMKNCPEYITQIPAWLRFLYL